MIRRTHPEAVFILLGPTDTVVREMAGSDDAMQGVRALGRIPFEELPAHQAAADLFLMPYADKVSNVGRWPNKVGDYMATGRPTVSNPIGDVRWLFEKYGVGLLAEPDAESMAAAALELIGAPERAQAMGDEARRVAEEVFAWDKLIVELEDWYFEILGAPQCLSSRDNRA